MRYLPGIALTVVVAAGLAWTSALTLPVDPDVATIRLSWRAPVVRVETCRTLSAAEQEEVAAHMRRSEECAGTSLDHEVHWTIDGAETVDTVAPSGARRDRPVYVLRDRSVAPGLRTVRVSFRPVWPDGQIPDSIDVPLVFEDTVRVGPHAIALITLDAARASLIRR